MTCRLSSTSFTSEPPRGSRRPSRRREETDGPHQIGLGAGRRDERGAVAATLFARRLAEDAQELIGVRNGRGLARERSQRGVLLVALLQRAVARVLHHLERTRERHDHAAVLVPGDADAVASHLAGDRMLDIVAARRAVLAGGPDHLGAGFRCEARVGRPEIASHGVRARHPEDSLPRRVDVPDHPIRGDHDDRVAKGVHRRLRVEGGGAETARHVRLI